MKNILQDKKFIFFFFHFTPLPVLLSWYMYIPVLLPSVQDSLGPLPLTSQSSEHKNTVRSLYINVEARLSSGKASCTFNLKVTGFCLNLYYCIVYWTFKKLYSTLSLSIQV